MEQDIVQLRTDIRLLIKQFTIMSFEKVNTVVMKGKASKLYDSDVEEETNYLDQELVSF